MARWQAGNQSTTIFKMEPESRFDLKHKSHPLLEISRPSWIEVYLISSSPSGRLSQVLSQGRSFSDEGELWGCCVPCKCYQVCSWLAQLWYKCLPFHCLSILRNVCRYFVCRALQFPPEAWLRISLKHASITWITIRSNNWKWNCCPRKYDDIYPSHGYTVLAEDEILENTRT